MAAGVFILFKIGHRSGKRVDETTVAGYRKSESVAYTSYLSVPPFSYPLRANLAGWDNEPRIAPRLEAEMTFTYAVIADGGIVLCADSQITHTHRDQFGVARY
jgi:hypothetical protein